MQDLKEIIKNQLETIPLDVKVFILSTEMRTKTDPIANQQGLGEEQKIALRDEVLYVLLGLEMLSDFVKNVETEIGVPRETAEKIAIEIHKNVFSQVIESLRGMEQTLKEIDSQKKEEPQIISRVAPPISNILERQGATALRPDHMLTDHDGLEAIDGPHLHSQTIMPQEQSVRPAQTGGTIIDSKLSKMFRMPKEEGNDPYREPAN